MNERPLQFYMWPIVTSIHCPSCNALWQKPSFCDSGINFPPFSRNPENATPPITSYCPACGKQLPPLSELHATGRLRLPPVHNTQFIRNFEDLKAFFDRTSGHTSQLWDYWVSHSHLVLRIYPENDNTHAFVVCQGTRRVMFPQTSLESSFALSEFGPSNFRGLRLEDAATGTVIECGQIGIFHEATDLW